MTLRVRIDHEIGDVQTQPLSRRFIGKGTGKMKSTGLRRIVRVLLPLLSVVFVINVATLLALEDVGAAPGAIITESAPRRFASVRPDF